LSKKYPLLEEEFAEEQNRGLDKLKFLKSLSLKKVIYVAILMAVILHIFCLRPKCKTCPERNAFADKCGHDNRT
jgi:hypothetical protein